MKKKLLRLFLVALVIVFVLSFAATSFAYYAWPNSMWNQTIFGTVKYGTNSPKAILVQWNCYAAQAKRSDGHVMANSEVDGIIGPNSSQYIKNYQLKKGLQSDGVVGNATWTIMQSYVSSGSNPSTGKVVYSTHDAIKVSRTSMHKSNGRWYTFTRTGTTVRLYPA